MKKIPLVFLTIICLTFGVALKVQANMYNLAPISGPGDFQKLGDGRCIFYLGLSKADGWSETSDTSQCSWEPCCKYQMTGYTDYEYAFKKKCDLGTSVNGVESEEENKTKCMKAFTTCYCSVTPYVAPEPIKPKFIMPDIQITIPGLKLTPSSSIVVYTNPDGTSNASIPWIGEYLLALYNYGLTVAGILAAVVLMAGGILWLVSGGDASKITQAKELIAGSITGVIILSCSYIILYQINPDLTIFKPIGLGVLQDIVPAPENTTDFSAKCAPKTTGACAESNMSIFGSKASQASAICNAESGGNASIYNKLTKCTGGEYAVWGLFQFNLSANTFTDSSGTSLNCPKAFNKTWTNSSPTCTVVNSQLYKKCIDAASTASLSISNAKRLLGNKSNWGPWESNSKWCHFK